MVTAFAPSLILGERPARADHRRFQAARRNVERLQEGPAEDTTLRLGTEASLGAVCALVEGATGTTVTLLGADLPAGLQGRLPLRLLRRRADRCGKRLVLVATGRELRRVAAAAGLDTVGGAQPAALHAPGRRSSQPPAGAAPASPVGLPLSKGEGWGEGAAAAPSSTGSALRAASSRVASGRGRPLPLSVTNAVRLGGAHAGALVLAVTAAVLGAMLAWAVVPSATVRLTPAPEPWSVELPIEVEAGLKQPDVAGGRLPGRTISKEVVETLLAPTTGRRVLPDARAAGQVVFINKGDKGVIVPKGTVLLAGGVRFATAEDYTVGPSIAAGMQQRVGMGRVGVVAVGGGPSGNVERLQINKIEGPLAKMLDVQNDAPTRGGTERTIAHVTAEDRRKLYENLQGTLTERLTAQMKSQLPTGEKETAIPWAGQNPAVVEATFNKNVDDEAQTLTLTMKLRYGVTVFHNDAYNALIHQMAAARLGQQRPGFQVVPDTLQPAPPSALATDGGAVRLTGRATATVQPRLDRGELRRALANRSLTDARTYLSRLPGVAAYELESWPGWLNKLPWLGLRISVGVQRPIS